VRDRVHAVHGRADHAGQTVEVLAELWRVNAVEGRRERRVAVDRDLEALLAEAPIGIEVAVAHEPVDARRDDGRARDGALPREALCRDGATRDGSHGRVEIARGDGHLVARALLRVNWF